MISDAPTVGSALRNAAATLAQTSDTARLDAELLMAHALGVSRSELLLRRMRDAAPEGFDPLVARRAAHEPVIYILGHAEFHGLRVDVNPAVLIPRGDSETLIEAARGALADRPPARILDLGTGSGALLIAALTVWPDARGIGIDASIEALAIARHNAARHLAADRWNMLTRDWTAQDWAADLGAFDLVLANPPYVESGADLPRSVRDFEPARALFAGPDGLDAYRVLLPQLPALLASDGIALVEIGATQPEAVTALALAAGLTTTRYRDLGGRPRALGLKIGVASVA